MSNLDIIDSIKISLKKEQSSYQSEISNLMRDDYFYLSGSYQFFIKKEKIKFLNLRNLQSQLVRTFASFIGAKEDIFSVLNISDNNVLSQNPYLKIGPFQKDNFGILLSEEDGEDFRCNIVTKPFRLHEFIHFNSLILDYIAQPQFYTSNTSRLRLRVMHPDIKIGVDPLALAINTEDQKITAKFKNKFGNSGIENWATPFLSENILKQFILEDYCFTSEDSMDSFKQVLSQITNELITEGRDSFTKFDTNKQYIDFFHIGGENYEYDLISITETIFDFCNSIKNSLRIPSDDVWLDIMIREKLQFFIEELFEIRHQIENISLQERQGFEYKCFDIIDNTSQFKLGTIHLINGTFENALVSVGGINAFCIEKDDLLATAAILAKRF